MSYIDGGGWRLVRHVPVGNKWHKAQDQLEGTEIYGKPCGPLCSEAWSVRFDNETFDQFLFATGEYLINSNQCWKPPMESAWGNELIQSFFIRNLVTHLGFKVS